MTTPNTEEYRSNFADTPGLEGIAEDLTWTAAFESHAALACALLPSVNDALLHREEGQPLAMFIAELVADAMFAQHHEDRDCFKSLFENERLVRELRAQHPDASEDQIKRMHIDRTMEEMFPPMKGELTNG